MADLGSKLNGKSVTGLEYNPLLEILRLVRPLETLNISYGVLDMLAGVDYRPRQSNAIPPTKVNDYVRKAGQNGHPNNDNAAHHPTITPGVFKPGVWYSAPKY